MAPASQEPKSTSSTTTRSDGDSPVDNIAQVCFPYLHAVWNSGGARGGRTSGSRWRRLSASTATPGCLLSSQPIFSSTSHSARTLRLRPGYLCTLMLHPSLARSLALNSPRPMELERSGPSPALGGRCGGVQHRTLCPGGPAARQRAVGDSMCMLYA